MDKKPTLAEHRKSRISHRIVYYTVCFMGGSDVGGILSLPILSNVPSAASSLSLRSIPTRPQQFRSSRASINFLNSLLLPILAFILANLDKVIEVIQNPEGNR